VHAVIRKSLFEERLRLRGAAPRTLNAE
jgi:hypothetical protein